MFSLEFNRIFSDALFTTDFIDIKRILLLAKKISFYPFIRITYFIAFTSFCCTFISDFSAINSKNSRREITYKRGTE